MTDAPRPDSTRPDGSRPHPARLDLSSALDEATADLLERARARLAPWQEQLEPALAALVAGFARRKAGEPFAKALATWAREQEAAARSVASDDELGALVLRLQLETLARLEARTRGPAAPADETTYELDLAGAEEAPLGNLVAILDLWVGVVARASRGSPLEERAAAWSAPALRRDPTGTGLGVVFRGTPEMISELRAILGRMGVLEG